MLNASTGSEIDSNVWTNPLGNSDSFGPKFKVQVFNFFFINYFLINLNYRMRY